MQIVFYTSSYHGCSSASPGLQSKRPPLHSNESWTGKFGNVPNAKIQCATGSLLPVWCGCTGGQAASGTLSHGYRFCSSKFISMFTPVCERTQSRRR
jgi:hypothetical protein